MSIIPARLRRTLDKTVVKYLSSLSGWFPIVRESYSGAWQSGVTVSQTTAAANWAVFACVTLIASDIGKMPARVMQWLAAERIWQPSLNRPVLRRPNHFQTWPDFVKSWVFSLLLRGNTFVLKVRDSNRHVVAMCVLDPHRVVPLVSPSGEIFYELHADNLAGIEQSVTVPASEVMHDRINTLYHPLIGVTPIYANAMAATQSKAIEENSAKFFQNMSQPGGVMTAPGAISDETATRIKETFKENFSGDKIGDLLVLGDGLQYQPLTISAKDSQLIEQHKWTGEMICATFHVPPYKLGLGQMPTTNNVAALNQQYYDQCLHPITDSMERRLDEGLELNSPFEEIWFDTSELLRMDPATRYDAHSKAIGGGWLAPNEARRQEDLPPKPGGDSPMLQQQNYSLEALALRDERDAEASDDVQALAMNGAQVTSLQGLLTAAANGEIPAATVAIAIAAAFPLLTPQQIEAMVSPLENFEPATPDDDPDDTSPPTPEDDEPTEEEARAFVHDQLRAA